MANLNISSVHKRFGAVEVLKNIDLQIERGEFVVFVGPSGCGKSTLLRCISGLEEISEGMIEIGDVDVTDASPAKRGIAMVFQSYALYPHMTVGDNIGYPLRMAGISKAKRREMVKPVAEMLQLGPYLDRLPKALSGGQRQRVAIGRAIVRDPKVFLFDEPLSNLDAALRVQMRLELMQLKTQLPNSTMIYVTHDQVEAMTMADRIVVLRDGVVEQVGTPLELYERPTSAFVAGFIGSPKMNFLNGPYAEPYDAPQIGIRPENLYVTDGEGTWQGQVLHTEKLGADSFVYVDMGGNEPICCRLQGITKMQAGQTVGVSANGPVYRFDEDGKAILS